MKTKIKLLLKGIYICIYIYLNLIDWKDFKKLSLNHVRFILRTVVLVAWTVISNSDGLPRGFGLLHAVLQMFVFFCFPGLLRIRIRSSIDSDRFD